MPAPASPSNSPVGTIIVPEWLIASASTEPQRGLAVRVVDDSIVAVDTASSLLGQFPQDIVMHADDQVLLPGYVNAHVHLYGVLAHGIPVDPVDSFWSFLNDYWWPKVEDRLDSAMIGAATDWVCAEMLRSGTTSFYDILEAPNAIPDALFVERDVVARRGLRGVLSFEATERVSKANGQLGLQENKRLIDACRADVDSLVSGLMCFHTTFTCSPSFIEQAFAMATDLGVLCHAHCNEGIHEGEWASKHLGMRTLEFYDSIGVLSPKFLASQCVQLTPNELELVGASGMKVSHMPLANCEVGGGIAPVPEMLAGGVTVGLGSDGYINDMTAVMRGAFLLHKARLLDPGAMPGAIVLDMATESAARAIGLERVGRIEVGWKADLQLIDARFPTPATSHNLIDQIVLWRSVQHVRSVMVNGVWRVQNGEVLGADIEAMRARVHEQAMRLWS